MTLQTTDSLRTGQQSPFACCTSLRACRVCVLMTQAWLPAQGFHTTNTPRCALDVYQQYTYFDLTNLRCVLHQNSDTESADQASAIRSVASLSCTASH